MVQLKDDAMSAPESLNPQQFGAEWHKQTFGSLPEQQFQNQVAIAKDHIAEARQQRMAGNPQRARGAMQRAAATRGVASKMPRSYGTSWRK